MYKTYYTTLDPHSIFGMVGRCGGGHHTIWEDWSEDGRRNREAIISEFEAGMDQLCGHYTKLKQSISKEGFRNPIIITNGKPRRRDPKYLPPELRDIRDHDLLLLESLSGASRLWAAQQLNITVPAIVNDWTGRFAGCEEIKTEADALKYFKDVPAVIKFDKNLGFVEGFDQQKVGHHLGEEWREDKLVPLRAPLWVGIMNKYGYRVDRLPPFVEDILKNAGIVQPRA